MKKNKLLTIQEYDLPIIIHSEKEGGFVATCPDWQDCYAQGDTIEETITEISYVATALIELYKEKNMIIPLKLKKESKKSSIDLKITFPLVVAA